MANGVGVNFLEKSKQFCKLFFWLFWKAKNCAKKRRLKRSECVWRFHFDFPVKMIASIRQIVKIYESDCITMKNLAKGISHKVTEKSIAIPKFYNDLEISRTTESKTFRILDYMCELTWFIVNSFINAGLNSTGNILFHNFCVIIFSP